MNAMLATTPRTSRNGLPMLALIVGLLALPFAIAAGLYYAGWQPRTGQHGELLVPPRPLPANGLQRTDGQPLPTAELHGKWLLALSLDGPCDDDCLRRIDEMRRIQVSLNKDMGRLRRLVLGRPGADPGLAAAARQQPDLLTAVAPAGWLGDTRPAAGRRLHLVDPLGRRVIDYPSTVAPKDVRADLQRLLKFAWSG